MGLREVKQELKQLQELLLLEKKEDLEQYTLKLSGTSFSERRKQGICWYPVFMERSQYDAGERLLVRVSRPAEHKESHLFQSGKLVNLFSNAGENKEQSERVNGVVNQVREHDMLITLNSDDLPEWIHDGKLGVQLMFDENSYREMERTLNFLLTTEESEQERKLQVLLGGVEAEFSEVEAPFDPSLNTSQNLALEKAVNAKDVAIIHGPPGTGKTTTVVQTIRKVLEQEAQVLVCAPSNAAVDLLAEKLGLLGVNVVRIGHPARVTQDILSKTIDARIAHHDNYKDLKAVRKQAEEYYRLGHKYKRNFGHSEREQRKLLLNEARKLKGEAEQLRYYITNDILSKAQVIATTLVGANNLVLKGAQFTTVFIDEASQGLEPACWIPIIKANRVIFAGDHWQLPPTVKSYKASKQGLSITLFEKAIQRNKADILLQEQYRMNETIMSFSSNYFYEGLLKANGCVAAWKVFDTDEPVEFVDTAGCGFIEEVNRETRSTFNKEEVEIVLKHLREYLNKVEASEKLNELQDIGIIAPYKAQVGILQDSFAESGHIEDEIKKIISINTIDSFQGQERDVVYISLVRSNEKSDIGFLSDIRRMNVAMTRARKKLVVIGDSATIGNHEFYAAFLDFINENGVYRSAYELMY